MLNGHCKFNQPFLWPPFGCQVATMPGSRGCAWTISSRHFLWFCSFWAWFLRASIFWTLAERLSMLVADATSHRNRRWISVNDVDFPVRKLQRTTKGCHDLQNHQCQNNETYSIEFWFFTFHFFGDVYRHRVHGSHWGTLFWSIPHVMAWICWNPLAQLPRATWSWCDSAPAKCHLLKK